MTYPVKGEDIRRALGSAVHAARAEREMSQHAVARAAGVKQATISGIELGKHSASLPTLLAVAWALDVEPALLVTAVLARIGKPEPPRRARRGRPPRHAG